MCSLIIDKDYKINLSSIINDLDYQIILLLHCLILLSYQNLLLYLLYVLSLSLLNLKNNFLLFFELYYLIYYRYLQLPHQPKLLLCLLKQLQLYKLVAFNQQINFKKFEFIDLIFQAIIFKYNIFLLFKLIFNQNVNLLDLNFLSKYLRLRQDLEELKLCMILNFLN